MSRTDRTIFIVGLKSRDTARGQNAPRPPATSAGRVAPCRSGTPGTGSSAKRWNCMAPPSHCSRGWPWLSPSPFVQELKKTPHCLARGRHRMERKQGRWPSGVCHEPVAITTACFVRSISQAIGRVHPCKSDTRRTGLIAMQSCHTVRPRRYRRGSPRLWPR